MSLAILSYLDEPNPDLHVICLQLINTLIPTHWSDIADRLTFIESLAEQHDFKGKDLAALVAAKIHYELGSLEDAVQYALMADDLLDLTSTDLFTQTIMSEAIQQWINQCQMAVEEGATDGDSVELSGNHKHIIDHIFSSSLTRNDDFETTSKILSMAIEARSILRISNILDSVDPSIKQALLDYTHTMISYIRSLSFRSNVLRVLADYHISHVADLGSADPDAYFSAAKCALLLSDASLMSVIIQLAESNPAVSYQIAVDLAETASPAFIASLTSRDL
ncbi:hypothetical protein GEMRC1_011982 [Eukaryota sp. GEM-RC1]